MSPLVSAPASEGRPGRGFSLIELAIVIAAVGLLVAATLPAFNAVAARGRLLAAAQQLQADIGLARELASRLAQPVHLSFQPGPQWCYALSADATLDCRDAAKAQGSGALIKRVVAADYPDVLLMAAQPMALDPRNGARIGAISEARFALRSGQQLQISLGQLGRSSLCAPAQATAGTPVCAVQTSRAGD